MTDFDFQKFIHMIYVRDTTEKFVLCENYAFRFTTEVAGLMQPNQLSKPVLALLTLGRSKILRLSAALWIRIRGHCVTVPSVSVGSMS